MKMKRMMAGGSIELTKKEGKKRRLGKKYEVFIKQFVEQAIKKVRNAPRPALMIVLIKVHRFFQGFFFNKVLNI